MPELNARRCGILRIACLALLAPAAWAADEGDARPAQVLITNVAVWDGTSERAESGLDVLVEGELIVAIGSDTGARADARIVDGNGGTLIPGIIDAHVHLGQPIIASRAIDEDPTYIAALQMQAARILLQRGWTTVRDLGGPAQGLAKAIDEGLVDGPRIYPSAMYISQTSGHGDYRKLNEPHPNMGPGTIPFYGRYSLIADGPAEVRRAVRESLRHGATQIKVMAGGGVSSHYDPLDTTQYSPEELRAAVETAADWNTYVAVHAYTDTAALRALEAGVKVIEHGHLMTEKSLRELKRRDAYISSQSFGFVRSLNLPQGTPMAERGRIVIDGVDVMMETAKRLGIPVAFGTDSFGRIQAYEVAVQEFTFRKRWFDSPEILRQATSHNAKLLELTGPRNPYPKGPLGVIEVGAYADLLIVAGDPLADVSILVDHETSVALVMKGGKVYKNLLD